MKHTLKEIVKDTTAVLQYVINGVAFYNIDVQDTLYQLGINTTLPDAKDATFDMTEKAIMFMRWIRKAIDNNELIQLTK